MITNYKGFTIENRVGEGRFFVDGGGFKKDGYTSEALAKTAITKFMNASGAAQAAPLVDVKPAVKPNEESNVAATRYPSPSPKNAADLERSIKQLDGISIDISTRDVGEMPTLHRAAMQNQSGSRNQREGYYCGKKSKGRQVRAGKHSDQGFSSPSGASARATMSAR